MRVEFRKIPTTNTPFSLDKDGVNYSGVFKKLSPKMVEIDLNIFGELKHTCDGCLEDFKLKIDETSKLLINDGVYSGNDMDIIESFDGFIDFDEIAQSEIESIKSDYHYCNKCKNNFKE